MFVEVNLPSASQLNWIILKQVTEATADDLEYWLTSTAAQPTATSTVTLPGSSSDATQQIELEHDHDKPLLVRLMFFPIWDFFCDLQLLVTC